MVETFGRGSRNLREAWSSLSVELDEGKKTVRSKQKNKNNRLVCSASRIFNKIIMGES